MDQRQAFTNLKCLVLVGWFPPILAMACVTVRSSYVDQIYAIFRNKPIFNGNFRILKWRYLPILPYVRQYHRKRWPYMVQYLHFRFLK